MEFGCTEQAGGAINNLVGVWNADEVGVVVIDLKYFNLHKWQQFLVSYIIRIMRHTTYQDHEAHHKDFGEPADKNNIFMYAMSNI